MIANLLKALGQRASANFVNFKYRAKGTGEVSRVQLILGASTETLYKKDVEKLNDLLQSLSASGAAPHVIQAARELMDSRLESLRVGIGNNSAYTNADTYEYLDGFKGVRIHRDTGELYVSGLVQSKEVIVPGIHKVVKSSEKTIAKRKIENELPSGKFRLYKLDNVIRAALNGEVLELTTADE